MTAAALLHALVAALDAAGVPFMLTGSLAAAFHGAGRATMDIDVVIDPTAPQLRALVRALAETGVYVSSEAAEEALRDRSAAVHGAGRATLDIDMVIDPISAQLHDLVKSLRFTGAL